MSTSHICYVHIVDTMFLCAIFIRRKAEDIFEITKENDVTNSSIHRLVRLFNLVHELLGPNDQR